MKQRSHQRPDDSLDQARRRLEQWRKTRSRGQRIPTSLWAAAVDAAREHGVSRASKALKLGYYDLKGRLESTPKPSRHELASAGGFLEIPLLTSSTPECVFELENGQARLRVVLKGAAPEQLEALARALWSTPR
jgi:hypothetical protein